LPTVRTSSEGTAIEKIGAYLTRQRDVLRGCRIGRLAADPGNSA
jgi:TetR/AcrR family transcriptional repressor of nem operon